MTKKQYTGEELEEFFKNSKPNDTLKRVTEECNKIFMEQRRLGISSEQKRMKDWSILANQIPGHEKY